MCQPNNASIEDVRKAEVECLRRQLAEKDKEIKHLNDLLDNALAELDKYIQGAEFLKKHKEQDND